MTIGERSLKALLAKYGRPTLDAAIDAIFDASERQMRAAIASVPEGRYSGERLMDHDGIVKDRMIKVHVTLHVAKSEITFDFTGSDAQVPGYVNSTLPNTASSAFLALFMSLGSEIRFNEGALAHDQRRAVDDPGGGWDKNIRAGREHQEHHAGGGAHRVPERRRSLMVSIANVPFVRTYLGPRRRGSLRRR